MEPNYSEYSTLELEDALADVDKNAFPERVERIESELRARQITEQSTSNKVSDKQEDISGSTLEAAPRMLRLVNHILDALVVFIFAFVASFIMSLIGLGHVMEMLFELPDIVFGLLMYLIYYVPLEAITGKSVGKHFTKTKVVNLSGEKPDIYQIAGRTFARMIPFEPLSIFRSSRDCWHDSLANTKVVLEDDEQKHKSLKD